VSRPLNPRVEKKSNLRKPTRPPQDATVVPKTIPEQTAQLSDLWIETAIITFAACR
jgi:hypothetical protein